VQMPQAPVARTVIEVLTRRAAGPLDDPARVAGDSLAYMQLPTSTSRGRSGLQWLDTGAPVPRARAADAGGRDGPSMPVALSHLR